jgi:diguanylate cyclase (GGDEF)-like protein
MFFAKKAAKQVARTSPAPAPAPPTAPPSAPPSSSAGDASIVLDALGSVLQTYARFTLDTEAMDAESSKAKVTEWMRHVTMGARHPTRAGDTPGGLPGRDWRGLAHFMGDHRRNEHQYVQKGMRELRDTIWAIVASAHRVAEADAGQPISEQLEQVRAAVEGSDIASIRREALAAIQIVGSLMDRQRDDQRREFVALADRVRALGTQLEEARRESMIDPLTQLANRKGFEEFLERTIALHTLSGEPASLLMIDMDKFKIANDTFGHDVGDAALRAVGDCLARVFLRRCDLVCRYGGDEFAVLLTETASLKAATLGERVASAVREARLPERAATLSLNLSVGVAELTRGDSASTWLQRADAALYAAKQNGGGRVNVAGDQVERIIDRAGAALAQR